MVVNVTLGRDGMLDPSTIDLATLASLAGASANEHLLAQIRAGGHSRIRVAHGWVFQHLVEATPTVGELAERLGVTQQAASKSVLELESLGYVQRRADASDDRIRRVTLTTKGRAVIERARAARAKLEARLTAALGKGAMNTARRALVALLDETGGTAAVAARSVKLPSP